MSERIKGEILLSARVAIYPLHETEYERGKCYACEYEHDLKWGYVEASDIYEYIRGYSFYEQKICDFCKKRFTEKPECLGTPITITKPTRLQHD